MEGRHRLRRRFGLIALVVIVVAVANRRRHRGRAAEPVASVAVTDASDSEIEAVIDEPAEGGPTVTTFAASAVSLLAEPDEPEQQSETTAPAAPTIDLEQIERDLDGVTVALARLDEGTYWTDEVTGEPLVDELLVADPVARRNR